MILFSLLKIRKPNFSKEKELDTVQKKAFFLQAYFREKQKHAKPNSVLTTSKKDWFDSQAKDAFSDFAKDSHEFLIGQNYFISGLTWTNTTTLSSNSWKIYRQYIMSWKVENFHQVENSYGYYAGVSQPRKSSFSLVAIISYLRSHVNEAKRSIFDEKLLYSLSPNLDDSSSEVSLNNKDDKNTRGSIYYHIVIIRNNDSGYGYIVGFDRKGAPISFLDQAYRLNREEAFLKQKKLELQNFSTQINSKILVHSTELDLNQLSDIIDKRDLLAIKYSNCLKQSIDIFKITILISLIALSIGGYVYNLISEKMAEQDARHRSAVLREQILNKEKNAILQKRLKNKALNALNALLAGVNSNEFYAISLLSVKKLPNIAKGQSFSAQIDESSWFMSGWKCDSEILDKLDSSNPFGVANCLVTYKARGGAPLEPFFSYLKSEPKVPGFDYLKNPQVSYRVENNSIEYSYRIKFDANKKTILMNRYSVMKLVQQVKSQAETLKYIFSFHDGGELLLKNTSYQKLIKEERKDGSKYNPYGALNWAMSYNINDFRFSNQPFDLPPNFQISQIKGFEKKITLTGNAYYENK